MNKIEELKSKYEYYNYFNVDEILSYLIEKKVSDHEKEEYKCKIINCTRLENTKEVNVRELYSMQKEPFIIFAGKVIDDDYDGPDYMDDLVPKKDYTFFVIYKKSDENELMKKNEFNTDRELFYHLAKNTLFYDEPINSVKSVINGKENKLHVIDIKRMEIYLPYLKNTFYALNKWRIENTKVKLDKNVLNYKLKARVKKI